MCLLITLLLHTLLLAFILLSTPSLILWYIQTQVEYSSSCRYTQSLISHYEVSLWSISSCERTLSACVKWQPLRKFDLNLQTSSMNEKRLYVGGWGAISPGTTGTVAEMTTKTRIVCKILALQRCAMKFKESQSFIYINYIVTVYFMLLKRM